MDVGKEHGLSLYRKIETRMAILEDIIIRKAERGEPNSPECYRYNRLVDELERVAHLYQL